MKRLTLGLLLLTLGVPAAAPARTVHDPGVDGWCGTRASNPAISYARHLYNQKRLDRERGDRLVVGEPGVRQAFTVTKRKNIAVIEDDGTILLPPRLFDLINNGVQFKRSGPGTRAERFVGGVSDVRGNPIAIGDDDSRAVDLPFSFVFYGISYDRVFINSDGNLTFNDAESASSPRSLIRFVEGPPRIAVQFLDLDPSAASGGGEVYLLEQPDMVRVTWLNVPEFGLTNSNTFQVTLYPSGRITMAYGGIDANVGVVGVSPGGPGSVNLLDLSDQLPVNRSLGAIAEEFRDEEQIDDLAAARAVFSAVRDEYDLLVVFADFPIELQNNAFAYNAPIKNDIRGIGDAVGYDDSALYGSRGRLEAFVQMGSLAKYPGNPNSFITSSEAPGIGVLAHEVGHRWLAFTRFLSGGLRSTALLGRQLAHWSFLMDSDGSVMEGNDIRDNGNGTFTTVGSWRGFSRLDQYLMGFRRPEEVQPFFYVTGSDIDAETGPSTGVRITGQRRDVNLDQIIAVEGPRVPGFADSQKVIQVAFVLLGRQGEPPSLASIKKVNQYRNRLATYFREQTGGRGRIATWLRLKKAVPAAKRSGG